MREFVVAVIFLCLGQCWCWKVELANGHFDRFDCSCKQYPNIKVRLKMLDHSLEDSELKLNMTIDVADDIGQNLSYSFKVERCKSKESPDTCENFYEMKDDAFCKFLGSEAGPWSGFFDPPFICPIKKGHYASSEKSSLKLVAMPIFPVNGWFWRMKSRLSDSKTGEVYGCCITELRVLIH